MFIVIPWWGITTREKRIRLKDEKYNNYSPKIETSQIFKFGSGSFHDRSWIHLICFKNEKHFGDSLLGGGGAIIKK